MQAFTSKSKADWVTFLRGLGGSPARVVCDNDLGLTAAVRAVFPNTYLYLCEWHVKHALDRLLKALGADEPDRRVAFDLLRGRLNAAFTGPSFWRPFAIAAHAVGSRRLSDWLDTTGRLLEGQFARRGLSTNRPAGMPLSTSPMDAFTNPVKDASRPRAYALKNRERTNRMLMLMQLHVGQNVLRYALGGPALMAGRPNEVRRAQGRDENLLEDGRAGPPRNGISHLGFRRWETAGVARRTSRCASSLSRCYCGACRR
jgi:hypothetical protein